MPRTRAALALPALVLVACTGAPAPRPPPASPAPPVAPARAPEIGWSEHFDQPPLDWIDHLGHPADQVDRVYRVEHEGPLAFLHARHDARPSEVKPPPAIHYGHSFEDAPIPLERVKALRWRWRVRAHPPVSDDPWQDLAASLYVITKTPSLLWNGKGWKLGWLAKPGPEGTFQRGLLQVPLRSDPASGEWRSEQVDLCAMHRKTFGACEGEVLRYVGVVTDADGTKSVAEADYADFELVVGER